MKTICSESNSITFYGSLGMRKQIENTQGTVPRHFNSAQFYALFAKRVGLTTKGLNIIRSKSNSITFYGSLGMRNQIEIQKERSQGTSIQHNSMHYLPRGGEGV